MARLYMARLYYLFVVPQIKSMSFNLTKICKQKSL